MLSFRRLRFQNISGREVSRGIPQEKAERCVESHTLTNPVGIMLQNLSLKAVSGSEAPYYPFSTYKVCFSHRLRRASTSSGDQLAPWGMMSLIPSRDSTKKVTHGPGASIRLAAKIFGHISRQNRDFEEVRSFAFCQNMCNGKSDDTCAKYDNMGLRSVSRHVQLI